MNKNKLIQLAVGIAISLVFLYFAVKDVNFGEVQEALTQTNWLYAIGMVVVFLGGFYFRAFRWQLFLEHIEKIPSHKLVGPMMIGFGFNNIFPARAGEFVRPYALTKISGVKYFSALSSLLVERIADVITLLGLMIILPFILKLDPNVRETIAGVEVSAGWIESNLPKLSIVAAVALLGCFSLVIKPIKELYLKILDMLPLIPEKIKETLRGLVESVSMGLSAVKSPRVVALSIFYSLIIWLSSALSFMILSWGFPGLNLTFAQSIGFLIVTCLVISLPSSPGFWGVYELGGKLAILMMGVVPKEQASLALTFTLVCHFLQWLPITIYGLWAAGKLHVSASDVEQAEEMAEEKLEANAVQG